MLDLLWVMVDHPRNVVDGCCYVLKFWLDRIYSCGDSVIFRFSRFGLNLHITPTFRGLWGIFPQNDVTYRPTPKGTTLRGSMLFEP